MQFKEVQREKERKRGKGGEKLTKRKSRKGKRKKGWKSKKKKNSEKNRKGKKREGKEKIAQRKGRQKGFPDPITPAAWENRAMREIDFMTEVKNQVKNCLGEIKYFVQPENKGFVSLSGSLFLVSTFV